MLINYVIRNLMQEIYALCIFFVTNLTFFVIWYIMPTQEWIRATLKDKGFKLKDVALALGIPAPRITDILKGAREVQSDEVVPLADMLGISPRSLLKSLAAGEKVILPADNGARLPVTACLLADGPPAPLLADLGFDSVPVPPDAATTDGLSCYVMGDQSMMPEAPANSLVIAADPKRHYAPIIPGALLLIRPPDTKGPVLRLYVKRPDGSDWLVATNDRTQATSWRFSLLSDLLPGTTQSGEAPVLRLEDVEAVVLWVHQRRSPRAPR
jgi:transcriptional regulator with XRE-family HTH domain